MSYHVYIASSTFAEYDDSPLKILDAGGLKVTSNLTKKRLTSEQLIKDAFEADAVIAGLEVYDAEVLKHLKKLRCISRCGVGVDNIDLAVAKKRQIKIFNTPQAVIQPVAELTLAMILDLLHKVTPQSVLMHQHQWQRMMGNQLAGKTVGIIGLGAIGRRVAQLLSPFDVELWATDVRPDYAWANQHGVKIVALEPLLHQADIVTLHLSISAQHPFCLQEKEIASMKKGAFLVNVSRGSLINESALLEALRRGHLAGAGLDAFEQEPYVGPLCDLPNVILTPHSATLTRESRLQMEMEAVRNIINFLKPS